MKRYKCPVCSAPSCGDDLHTVTQYVSPERALGDRMKVILLQLYDAVDRDNLQVYELKVLVNALIDEHFEEE